MTCALMYYMKWICWRLNKLKNNINILAKEKKKKKPKYTLEELVSKITPRIVIHQNMT